MKPPGSTEALPNADTILGTGQFRLEVIVGPDTGRTIAVTNETISVGKGADCTLCLTDSAVSRHHFEIVPDAAGYRIVDAGSTNGTLLDRARIREAILALGQIIAIGRTTLRFGPDADPTDLAPSARTRFGDLVADGAPMRRIFAMLDRIARTDATVLIMGESGTGKDVAARAIHGASRRAAGPFVVFDASAAPASVIESELFGHEKGSFTGAVATRAGLFETASGGTLFIDEIGELPIELQPRLLRAIEGHQIKRVGSDRPRTVDIRLIAATNRDLRAMMRSGTFRSDLYWRLSVAEVLLPPLRERPEDIASLTAALTKELGITSVDEEIMRALSAYPWPGNVRQLRNTLERARTMGGETLDLVTVRRCLDEAESF